VNQLPVERYVGTLASIGAALVTVFLLTGNVSDPVNAPKFFLLGAIATSLFAVTLLQKVGSVFQDPLSIFNLVLLVFVSWALVTTLTSDSPLTQNMYGVYGRNTGFLTYLFLAFWAFSMSRVRENRTVSQIVWGFTLAGFVNVAYCSWVVIFGDFIGWNNPYKAILGTFGNPNFISAFLGMFLTVILSLTLKKGQPMRWLLIAMIPVTVFLLLQANSLQGIVISAVGLWLVSFYWFLTSLKNRVIAYLYFGAGLSFGAFGLLGIAGFGPMVKIMAQPTVAFREQYWLAAWKLGMDNPFFGVGLDSYGDWYRRARSAEALITPGPEVVTNAAHNVYLDIFASGGFPFLISYIALTFVGLLAIIKVLRSRQTFDPVFASVAVIWFAYHLQSVISINQIGLAIWGWISTGLLVAYSRINSGSSSENGKANNRVSPRERILSPGIVGFLGLVVGSFIAVPPLSADMKWSEALKTQNVESLESSLQGGYFTQLNSSRLSLATQTLERSKLHDLALKYGRIGIEFNPSSDDAWEQLYFLTAATQEEKKLARQKLILLDPLNPQWKDLP
jgi:O-antigen ligase